METEKEYPEKHILEYPGKGTEKEYPESKNQDWHLFPSSFSLIAPLSFPPEMTKRT